MKLFFATLLLFSRCFAQIDCNNQIAAVNALAPTLYNDLVATVQLPAGYNGLTYQKVMDAVNIASAFIIGAECNRQKAPPPPPPPPTTLNLPTPTIYTTGSLGSSVSNLTVYPLTTGSNAKGYTLNSSSSYFTAVPSGSEFTWYVYASALNSSGVLYPSALVAFAPPASVTTANVWSPNTNTPSGIVLAPNTTYFIGAGRYPYGLTIADNCCNSTMAGWSVTLTTGGEYPTFPDQGGTTPPATFPAGGVPDVVMSQYITVTPVQ